MVVRSVDVEEVGAWFRGMEGVEEERRRGRKEARTREET